jgi:PcfJ-like protein
MIVQDLADGVRFEFSRGAPLTVLTHRGMLEIAGARGARRTFASSRAGVRAVVDRLAYLAARGRGPVARGPQQELFALGPARTEDDAEDGAIERVLLSALRRSAERRASGVVDAVAAIARERATPLVFSSTVLELPYFLRDAARHRAAAIAAAQIEAGAHASESLACADALFSRLAEWPRLFARSGVVSRALTKTLAELPADAAGHDVWALGAVELVCPVKSALHLRLLAERARGAAVHLEEHARRIQLADERELEDLRARAAEALGLQRLPTAEKDHVLIEVIVRSGDPGARDSLRALVRRGLAGADWRRRHDARANHRTATARPPIALPNMSGVTFLATVGEVMQEGERMGHCVGSHAPDAATGQVFLFHVEHAGTHATVEVDPRGQILDAQGPHNRPNAAAEYGERALSAWGAGLWAARTGDLDRSTWPAHAPPAPTGFVRLSTTRECMEACQQMTWTLGTRAVAAWFTHHVDAVLAGEAVLVVSPGDEPREARALDLHGEQVGRFPARRTSQGARRIGPR